MRDSKDNDLLYEFGHRLRVLRQAKGMTGLALAKAAGLTSGYLCDVELGKVNISIVNANKIALALGADLFTLFLFDERRAAELDAVISLLSNMSGRQVS